MLSRDYLVRWFQSAMRANQHDWTNDADRSREALLIQEVFHLALLALDRPAERGESYVEETYRIKAQALGPQVSGAISSIPPERTADARWIPVSEKLPENFQRVLCCGKGPDVIEHAYYDAWLQPEQGGTPVIWMMFGRMRLLDDAVTHWMPLPPAPLKEPKDG